MAPKRLKMSLFSAALLAFDAAFFALPWPVAAQGLFPPGYDVPLSSPYGEITIERPDGPALRPLAIYFSDSAWPNKSGCQLQNSFDALETSGIAVAELWMSGNRLDRDIRSIREGLRTIRQRARSYRLDLSRIILVGCGAGGHFAALVGTNPEFMARAGLDFSAIAGVAVIEGAGFDLRAVAAEPAQDGGPDREKREYFSGPPANLELYSPLSHLALPNAPSILLAEAGDVEPSASANDFGRRLQATGSELVIESLPLDEGASPDGDASRSVNSGDDPVARYIFSRLGAVPPRP